MTQDPVKPNSLTGKFHWTADNIPDNWLDIIKEAATSRWPVTSYENQPRFTVSWDKTMLDFRIKNGKARDSIPDEPGCWKAVLFLLKLSKSFTVIVVDDEAIQISVRSLKKLTNLGFTEDEYDDFAESLGLINNKMAKTSFFANFF
jgi:hypothetical protein